MDQANDAQAQYWDDQAGQTWVEMQPLLDVQLAPLGASVIDALDPRQGEHVLDIGCGCGATALALASRVVPGGAVLGLDISGPMLDVARREAAGLPGLSFMQADAQTARFDTVFDAAFSRFGVMFFADPAAAFANIRAALRPGGRLAFVCWRAPAENPWMMVPLEAALGLLPEMPQSDPDAPGPFAFARAGRVNDILAGAGFTGIELAPLDTQIGGFPLNEALTLALRVGPLGKVLREKPALREPVTGAVREALAKHETPRGVWLESATWVVSARA